MTSRTPSQNRFLRNFRKDARKNRRTNNIQIGSSQYRGEPTGVVGPKKVKKLTSSLKISVNDIRGSVRSFNSKQNEDSQQHDYTGLYFERANSSVAVVEDFRNATESTLNGLLTQIKQVANEYHDRKDGSQPSSLPDEIYLAPAADLGDDDRQNLIRNTIASLNKAKAPEGKEYRRELFNGYVKLKLVDIPKEITVNNKVMGQSEFEEYIGGQAKVGKEKHAEAMKALGDYKNVLEQQSTAIKRNIDQLGLSQADFNEANQAVQAQVNILKSKLEDYQTYLSNKEAAKIITPESKRAAKIQKEAVDKLIKQLDAANKRGTNEVLEVIRQNYWLRAFNPLNANTARQGVLLGKGAQDRQVFSKIFNTKDRPDLPQDFEAAVKFNSNEANGEATRAGIPREYPEEAKRSIASYEVNRLLSLDSIPLTMPVLGTNPDTGNLELGSAMKRVKGVDGQLFAPSKKAMKPDALKATGYYKHENPDEVFPQFARVQQDGKEVVVEKSHLPIQLSYGTNPVIQKGLADLQILDQIIGHADRHFGNIRFEGTGPDKITGVKGIDNDDTFGKDWVPRDKPQGNNSWTSKTPDIPPIVDAHTAVNIMRISPNDLEPLRTKLTDDEYEATKKRLKNTQKQIIERIKGKRLAIMPNQTLSQADKAFLATAAELPDDNSLNQLLEWGDPMVYHAHLPLPNPQAKPSDAPPVTNSYLGEMVVMGRARGFAPWPDNATPVKVNK